MPFLLTFLFRVVFAFAFALGYDPEQFKTRDFEILPYVRPSQCERKCTVIYPRFGTNIIHAFFSSVLLFVNPTLPFTQIIITSLDGESRRT